MAPVLGIKLRCGSWQQLATIYKRDLSRGAMFLKATSQPAIGTLVKIDLELPSATVIELSGVIVNHVVDPQRGTGVDLKLEPLPTKSVWLIESALAAEMRMRTATPASGVPAAQPEAKSGPTRTITEGEDVAAAEQELLAALEAEVESLKRLNPFLVLGVGYEASDSDVRAAFGELTKRYHPDRFARYRSQQLRQIAAEIFILIRDAYRKVADAAGRAQVVAQLKVTPKPRPAAPARKVTPPRVAIAVPPKPPPASQTTDELAVPVAMPEVKSAPVRAVADVKSGPVRVPPKPESDPAAIEALLEDGKLDEALAAYRTLAKKLPQDRVARAGIELCEGLRALAQRDRMEAAQRFEAALEIDPSNERAARELAEMRRQATNERKGLLSRLMGKKEPP